MARMTRGRLFKRGKQGRFYLQYYVNGKEFKVALRDENGNPITKEDKAKKAADMILAPLRYKNEAQRLQAVVNELSSTEEKAASADRDLKNQTATIENGWKVFCKSAGCSDCIRRYSALEKPPARTRAYVAFCYYADFKQWMYEKHPEILLLSEVTEDIASEYFDFQREHSTECTANAKIATMKTMFRTLIEDERISIIRDPFKRIRPLQHHPNSKKPLTVEQIAKLIQTATGEIRVLIALGYFTGLRLGDCCTLQWREVDLIRGVIERIPNKMRDRVKDPEQVKVKVGISRALMRFLLELPGDRTGFVLPECAKYYDAKHASNFNRILNPLFHACGIETIRPGTGKGTGKHAVVEIGFHSLRYSYISHNAEAGTPAAIIQRNAGHSNPAMTEHYTKISDAAAVKYAAALQLPENIFDEQTEIIDVTPDQISTEDPERTKFRQLADSLSLDQIKAILANIPEAQK